MSVPNAMCPMPAATPAAPPPEDPPGVSSGSRGLCVCVCAAIEQVACKPTHGKRWHVAAPKHHCACPHHIVHGRTVEFGDEFFLQPAPIARGEPYLVDVQLDSDR